MSMSETERLRKDAARDYRRIAELEAESRIRLDAQLTERRGREQAEAERDALRSVYRELTGKGWDWDPRPREEGEE